MNWLMGFLDGPAVSFPQGSGGQLDGLHDSFSLQLRPISHNLVQTASLGQINQGRLDWYARTSEGELTMTYSRVGHQVLSDLSRLHLYLHRRRRSRIDRFEH